MYQNNNNNNNKMPTQGILPFKHHDPLHVTCTQQARNRTETHTKSIKQVNKLKIKEPTPSNRT